MEPLLGQTNQNIVYAVKKQLTAIKYDLFESIFSNSW